MSDDESSRGEQPTAPDLGESLQQLGATSRAGLAASVDVAKAFRALVATDFSLARSAFGRTLAFTGVAIAFGAVCWLLLMAAAVSLLVARLGWSWALALGSCGVLSGVITAGAAWLADRYFDHTRMKATRRQLARLGLGELSDFMPSADSAASTRESAEQAKAQASAGVEMKDKQGIDVTPP